MNHWVLGSGATLATISGWTRNSLLHDDAILVTGSTPVLSWRGSGVRALPTALSLQLNSTQPTTSYHPQHVRCTQTSSETVHASCEAC